ncbi:MAG TPA: DUF6029 family protein [Bacteroidia bacterium]
MKKHFRKIIVAAFFCGLTLISNVSVAQLLNNLGTMDLGDIHGNFQSTAQYYVPDSTIGAAEVPEKMLFNGFMNLIYTKGKFTAGVRYESYLNRLQGYPAAFQGTGISYRYATYKSDFLEVTVGSFYEQFGNGLSLRTYEERNLGLDNALDGVRIKAVPVKGVYLKGLIGKQRLDLKNNSGLVRGFDGEIQLNEAIKQLADKKLVVSVGGSFVSKFQEDKDPALVLPQNVGTSAGRLRISRNNFSLNTEYAQKINDPSLDNKFIYKPGEALLVQASYAQKGFSLSLAGSHIDNMSFRSDRNAQLTTQLLNYVPALNKQHTYNLLAFYPYSSQPNGETQFSAEVSYKVIKKPKYKLDIVVNYSGSDALDTFRYDAVTDTLRTGYKVKSWLPASLTNRREGYLGNTTAVDNRRLFREFYVEVNQKFGKKIKSTLIYSNQFYNKDVIQKPGDGKVFSTIVVADITYKLKTESAIRLELQGMFTEQDHQDWAYGLLEYTFNSNIYVAVGDQWNFGNNHSNERYHYYNVSAGYIKNANRIELTYGKQRAGIFCVGGVCRNVPASNGVTLTVTSSF